MPTMTDERGAVDVDLQSSQRASVIIEHSKIDLVELILSDIGGTFKKYQILNYILFCIPFTLSGTFGLSYVFTALNLDYR